MVKITEPIQVMAMMAGAMLLSQVNKLVVGSLTLVLIQAMLVTVNLIQRQVLLNNKSEHKLEKRQLVLKHILKTSMQRLNMKKGKEKRLGTNSINK